MKRVYYKGKEYKSPKEFYKSNKNKPSLSYRTLMNRINEGMTVEEAFKVGKKTTGFVSKFGNHTVEGVKYINLPSIAKEYGISLGAIYKRYSLGSRNDNLVPFKKLKSYVAPKKKEKYKFFVNGVGYKSMAEACSKHNVIYGTFRTRIVRGCTPAQALGIDDRIDNRKDKSGKKKFRPGKRRWAIKLSLKGKNYNSIDELAKDYNKPYSTVYNRIVNLGLTPEEAIKAGGSRWKKIVVEGKTYESLAYAARAYNLRPETVLTRLQVLGHTLDQALGLETVKTKHSIEYKGKVYRSLPDLAKKYNLSPTLLQSRIHFGMPLPDAIKLGNKKIANEGRYNEKILNRNPKLASKTAFLYFVSIIVNGKNRYKIGITALTIKDRLKQEPYKYKVIKKIKSTLLKCYLFEQQLLKKFSKFRDKSFKSQQISGFSEIFNFPQDIVNQVLVNIKKKKL